MEVEADLVYIFTSLKGNISLPEEFKRRFGNHVTTKQYNDLGDVIVETQRGLEMAQMTSDVSAHVSNVYNKILDSDLNQAIKYLITYSVVLSILATVSGFYGGNIKLPLANGAYLQVSTILITIVLMLAYIIFLINRHWWK